MARKDVDLVIRAKDEAAKVVDAITAAVNGFVDAQTGLQQTSGKTGSVLDALGAAVGGLKKELKGVDVAAKVAEELDKAAAAASRLQTEFASTQAAADKLARDLGRAEAATDKLTTKAAGAASAQQKNTAALERSRAAQAKLTSELTAATRERDKLARQENLLKASIEAQGTQVQKAQDRHEKLTAKMQAAAKVTATMRQQVEQASISIQNHQAKLVDLRERYGQTQAAVSKTVETMTGLSGRLEEATSKVARQETVVAKITANYKTLDGAAKTAGRNQRDLATETEKAGDKLAVQSGQLDKAEKELLQIAAAADKAGVAMAELASRSGASLQRAFDQQRRSMLETKREWVAAQAEVKRLGQEIGQVGVPTREMAAAFDLARAKAVAGKESYQLQRDGLHQLGGIMRQTGTDIGSLAAKQQAFTSVQDRTSESVGKIKGRVKEAEDAYNKLSGTAAQAAQGVRAAGSAAAGTASGTGTATTRTNALAEAYRKLYGESRQAMSMTQRLRGEVLSMVSAYGGLYGVINLLRQTVTAYQTLEAATSRLNIAFGGDKQRVGEELDFIRRNADRLGIEFGTLAGEYSKFAVATKGTNLEGEKTRKIFISVAQAARVNKSSNEEMQGVFTALTQIVSKGAVQMEELRQQLGDRLPGALQLMADVLGVTTGELIKMMEQGKVSSDALVGFAEQLDKKFGPGLTESLSGLTTALGQLKNAAFQALVQFGEAGFIEGFTTLVHSLTETLKSADFQAFAGRASQAFGLMAETLALAASHFDVLVIAASAFAGIKFGPGLVALAGGLANVRLSAIGAGSALDASGTAAVGAATKVGVATTAFRGLTLAVRTLMSSTGIGLLITAVSVGIGLWATRADEATTALNAHQKLVDTVKNAYDRAGASAEKWAEEVKKLSVTEAQTNLAKLKTALNDIRAEARPVVDAFGTDTKGTVVAVNAAIKAFASGEQSAEKFRAEIDRIAQTDPGFSKALALGLLDVGTRAGEVEKKAAEANDILTALTGTAAQQGEALKRLSGGLDDTAAGAAQAATDAAKFDAALTKIKDTVPEINESLDELKKKGKLDDAFESAVAAAADVDQLRVAVDAYNASLGRLYQQQVDKQFGKITDGVEASAKLLRDRENFAPTPYADMTNRGGKSVNSGYRIGFGSDTITLADGSIQKVVQGMRVSVTDANRDLYRRIGEFQKTVQGQVSAQAFNAMTPQQQGALTSIAYNYGKLPDRLVEVIKSGTDEQIAAAIRALGSDNGGINRDRRNIEAAMFTSRASIEPMSDEAGKERERAAKDEAKKSEATAERLVKGQQEVEQQRLINEGKGREAEIEKEIAEARKENPKISAEEVARIREQTGALFDLKQLKKDDKKENAEAEQAMQRVNALVQQRGVLEQQMKLARQQGDGTKVEETRTAIEGVNTQLTEAIARAREMWAAIGGPEADTAAIKLDTAAARAGNLAAKAQQNVVDWSRVQNLFASGVAGAFDSFIVAVHEGENVFDAARTAFLQFASDFLRQIAQMIIQQAILNGLKSALGDGGGGGIGGFVSSLFGKGHTGGGVGAGRVGVGNATARINPAIFAGASRYHDGGVVGLQPGEVPIIAQEGEEVLERDDPRNQLNSAAQQQKAADTKIVNAFDTASFLEEALKTRVGEKAILNFVQANSAAIRGML